MSELLKDIDDAWFSDADDDTPIPGHSNAMSALGLETTTLPAPGSLTPMPIPGNTRLSTEDDNEFSRPNLAVGTVVDAQVPVAPWFSDLRELVPPRRAAASSPPPLPRALSARAIAAKAAEPEPERKTPRKSWWRRRKSKA